MLNKMWQTHIISMADIDLFCGWGNIDKKINITYTLSEYSNIKNL